MGGGGESPRPRARGPRAARKCFAGAEKPARPPPARAGPDGEGNLPLPKQKSEMTERRHGSNSPILQIGKGETEAQRGAGPCPAPPGDFRLPPRSARLAHCTAFVLVPPLEPASGLRRPEGEKGPPTGEQVSGLCRLPPRPASPPALKVVSVTPGPAGHQVQEAAAGGARTGPHPRPGPRAAVPPRLPSSPPPQSPPHPPPGTPAPAAG